MGGALEAWLCAWIKQTEAVYFSLDEEYELHKHL